MCGIAGYVLNRSEGINPAYIDQLSEHIRVRGPDDEGAALVLREKGQIQHYRNDRTVSRVAGKLPHIADRQARIRHDLALIHTRYAIVDLSDAGHQPFVSHDGSIVAVYNGEIYNYVELREELGKHGLKFETNSDTEVLVQGYRYWGDDLWRRLNGFWAVAIYDKRDNSLVLCRDRIGIAPLYYRHTDDGLFFSSSIKSLVNIEPEGAEIDRDIATGFIDTTIKDQGLKTYYKQIRSLSPASFVRIPGDRAAFGESDLRPFWHLPGNHVSASDWSFDDAVTEYRDTFMDAVRLRLRADVKVACELSGGLDSSSIVAAAAEHTGSKLTTYTIKVPGHDEEPFARAILERYPVDYRVLQEPEQTFEEEIDFFTNVMEEPYHSPNIFTHYKMRQRMKKDGTDVVLTGSGGDEVLAGYERRFWDGAREAIEADGLHEHVRSYVHGKNRNDAERQRQATIKMTFRRLRRVGKRIAGSTLAPLGLPVPGRNDSGSRANQIVVRRDVGSEASRLQDGYGTLPYFEQRRFHFGVGLLPYYLRSNDHFTMAIPLEARFPFLDYRMVELGMRMPPAYLFKDGWTKYILRKAMEPFLPKKILWRRLKMGFPFAYQRFLKQYQSRFAPMLDVVQHAGIDAGVHGEFDALVKDDPVRTWRICSTGLWLQKLDESRKS